MAEVRTLAEGTLRWILASGSGTTWATASAAASGTFGYVTEFSYTSGQRTVQISDRGVPTHNKVVGKDAIQVQTTFLWTGHIPSAISGSGASVPMFHIEHVANAPENGNTGRYHQFHGAVVGSQQLSEAEEGNTIQLQFMALAMNGPTASGYLG